MSTPQALNIAKLLTPISEDNPSGLDIRDDPSPSSAYNQIKDARSAARAAERNSLFDGDSSEAHSNWQKILELAPQIISEQAKDLEVAAWYTEALIRKQGFHGLRGGITLIRELIEQYWDNLYPAPDEDGLETRVAPLTGLNGEGAEGVLIAPIRNVAITEDFDPGPFTMWQYKQAREIQKIADVDARNEKTNKTGFSLSDIESVVSSSSSEFFIALRDDISTAVDEYRRIRELLDEHCGTHESPPTSNIINTLEETLSAIKHLAKLKLPDESADEHSHNLEELETNDDDATTPQSQSTAHSAGVVRTREEAFRQLTHLADFFQKTEPHSPISYAINRAIRWGNMPLEELMKELIPDANSREHYTSLTGIEPGDN